MDVRGFLVLPVLFGGLATWIAWTRRDGAGAPLEESGPVTMELGGLRLTVLRRHAPESADLWCRNALVADARCSVQPRELRASGTLLSAVDLEAWCGKLPGFMDGACNDLHLNGDGDCLSLYLHRGLRGGMTAVSVLLIEPDAGPARQPPGEELRESRRLLFLVDRDQLEYFRVGVEQAMLAFPVDHGGTARLN
jgi:hypothetical protein